MIAMPPVTGCGGAVMIAVVPAIVEVLPVMAAVLPR